MRLQSQARLILYVLGGGIVALLLALVLGAISVSGVISMTAANVFLWIAISILGISLVAIAVIYCPRLPGPKAAFLMLLLVAVASAGWYGRARLSSWLLKKKAEQQAVGQISAPPPGPKSEPSKTTTTSENTPRQNPKRRPVRIKKKIPTPTTTTPPPLPPAQTQTSLPSQQIGVGIVNNAPNNGTQVVQDNRQYGVSPPPPYMDFHQSQVDPWPDPPLGIGPMAQREKDMEIYGPNSGRYRPGVSLVVTLKGPFKYPQFWVRCSAPCSVNDASSNAKEIRTTYPDSSDPTVARVQFITPSQLPAGAKVFLDIRSAGRTKISVLAVGGGEPPD